MSEHRINSAITGAHAKTLVLDENSQYFLSPITGKKTYVIDPDTPISPGTDVSDTTATAEDVASGKKFHAADGTFTTGTASGRANFYKCASLLGTTYITVSGTTKYYRASGLDKTVSSTAYYAFCSGSTVYYCTSATPAAADSVYTYASEAMTASGTVASYATTESNIVVSGAGTDAVNGTYTLTSGTGSSRIWTYGSYRIYWDGEEGKWMIELTGGEATYYTAEDSDGSSDPWDLTWQISAGASPEPTVTESPATSTSWTGYKAVLTDGVYSFESALTTDSLTYSSVTPTVENVYTADALGKATLYEGMPKSGLVLYIPLLESKSEAETGQTLTPSGTISYQSVGGIDCAHLVGGSAIGTTITPTSTPSISFWIKKVSGGSSNGDFLVRYGNSSSSQLFGLQDKSGNFYFSGWNNDFSIGKSVPTSWIHVCYTYDGSNLKFYFDGALYTSTTKSLSLGSNGTFSIGSNEDFYICGVRLYSKVLELEEIALLASEFTPTAS